jgi:C-terminal processing protease CtpA/Prc
VAGNSSGDASISPGDEIVALNGKRIGYWLERTERNVSAESPYMAHSLMEYDFPIYLWLELGAAESFALELRAADGKKRRLQLPARTREEMEKARASEPPALDLEQPLREAKMLDAHVAYLRPGPFYNAEATTAVEQWDNSGFRAFIDKSFADFERAHADRLIIDLRGNPGGDNLFSDVMVAWIATRPFRFASQFKIKVSEMSTAANATRIAQDAAAAGPISQKFAALYAKAHAGAIVDFDIPQTPPRTEGTFKGKVFALVDRQTYSNAVAVAATMQDYKFGVVLGEETSDLATTYGAMEQFKLTNTGLLVGYPKAKIVRPSGDLRARGVVPDIRIRIPVVQSPADEVLREAVEISER